jgi:hypothetical protein
MKKRQAPKAALEVLRAANFIVHEVYLGCFAWIYIRNLISDQRFGQQIAILTGYPTNLYIYP